MIEKLIDLFISVLFSSVPLDFIWYLTVTFISVAITVYFIRSFVKLRDL